MARTVPIRRFRQELAGLLDEVERKREHVTITRNGTPAAVVVPVDEYTALEETAEILADAETMAAIRRGQEDAQRGDLHALEDVKRELRDTRD